MAVLAAVAPAQTARERMWPAPTAEDWKKPVRIRFQRTWEDALAVSKETGKPILICVNMDGEIASEHYAGIRYRQPEKAKLYEPYVCVIASVYRHTPRDFDEHGHRIECPRFGSVTCGEHIHIEPILYEKYFDGQRIAPRHIMVELDGSEKYDVYYAFDTDSVFQAIEEGITKRAIQPEPIVRGDRTIIERVASRDSKDRDAVEKAFIDGDKELRRKLLEAALEHDDAAPNGLLRLAVFGFDTELGKLARKALAQATSAGAVDVINEALRVPLDASERATLVAALERLGKSSRRARTLAVVHKGLDNSSDSVDVEGWSRKIAGGTYPAPPDRVAIETRLEETDKTLEARPKDPASMLQLAESTLELALNPRTAQSTAAGRKGYVDRRKLMLQDARKAALEAERLGATRWRVNTVIALAADELGNPDEAHARAIAAVHGMPEDEKGRNAASVLALFARARQRQIIDAYLAKRDWAGQWLTDVHSAYAVLARHPLGTDLHVVSHYDFLDWLGAIRQATRVLEQGLQRFPESWVLHDRLRGRILKDKGAAGLEPAYEAMLKKKDAPPSLPWFAGYTSIVAAEFHRRAGKPDDAVAAYGRAIAHYENAIERNPGCQDTADHYIAIALGGRARIQLERGDLDGAIADVIASFDRQPSAAAVLDGLNISAVDTAKMLRARLQESEKKELVAKLEAALGGLDPEQLELPAYERQPPGGARGGRRRGR